MAKDPYTQGLKAKFGSMMTGFPDLKLDRCRLQLLPI